jgi:Holliday junction resolvase
MKRKNPETIIQNAIRDYLRLTGWYVIRHQQGLGSHLGLCDLQAIRGGKTLYIEVKTPTGKLSEHQERFRDEIVGRGGLFMVARSLEDVIEYVG